MPEENAKAENAQLNSLNPFQTLQKNASDLFSQILNRHSAQMVCASGCSKCCHAEFSVFLGEALLIYEWFKNINPSEREAIQKQWLEREQKNTCAFLRNDRCTIYESRPVICRTQGAPLAFIENHSKKADEIVKIVDVCPLNFNEAKSIPSSPEDWFDLDRLTQLQAIAEKFIENKFSIPEILNALKNSEHRIPLRKLQQLLIADFPPKPNTEGFCHQTMNRSV